jgi:LPS O-antigen subunit length determinant protein (WzzB/FepE family)
MESSNNVSNNKVGKELDIRDIVSYLISRIWIIALVAVCAVVFASGEC